MKNSASGPKKALSPMPVCCRYIFRRSMAGVAAFFRNGGCVNLAISFGAADSWGSWHWRQFAVANGSFWCAFCKAASFGSWQSTHNAGAAWSVKAVLRRRIRSGLVRDVARVAAPVKSGVTTAFCRNVRPLSVAGEAEIVLLFARCRLQQLVLVGRGMRIVALQAVADRRRMHRAFDICHFLVSMAGQAKSIGRGRRQHDPGDILVNPDLMAAQAAHRDRRMNRFALRFIFVTFEAFCRVGVLIERNGVNCGIDARNEQPSQQKEREEDEDLAAKNVAAFAGNDLAEPRKSGRSLTQPPRDGCARTSPYHKRTDVSCSMSAKC